MMNIDRFMVNLFFEIKRNLPEEIAQSLNISSPNLGKELIRTFIKIDDKANQRLIEVFLERAGEDWHAKLVKVSSLVAISNSQLKLNDKINSKKSKKRYYRGVLIE